DATSLSRALPASVQHADPTAPLVRAVGAYYSPQAGGKWSAKFRRTDDKLKVTSNVRLLVGEQRLEAVGGLAIEPEGDKLFSLDLLAPPGWQVTQVTGAGNEALRFETFAAPMGGSRVHVRFPGGMPVGRITPVFFQAENTPTGWIGAWSQGKFDIAFPHFAVSGASRVEGAVAVSADEDLRVLPGAAESFQGLTPLDESEKARFSLAGLETAFAYRHDGPDYAASFSVERIVPTITARTLTFLKLDADNMVSHHELVFKIEQGRTRELRVQLPESTPKTLAVRGLGNVVVKEFLIDDAKSATEAQGAAATGATAGNAGAGNTSATSGWRTWRIVLAQHATDQVRLAIDFQQTLPSSEPKGLPLSLVRADSTQVNYQSGLVAVETAPELDVQLTVDQDGPGRPRKIDVGELAEADYVVGRRVLGAYGFVGGTPTLSADVFRRSALALPEAIVQRAELVTLVGATGRAATAARFQLRSKASFLELQLPEGAKLWSAVLDDQPMAPQRNDRRLL
ncbi:MAG TPA: hypothetical protein PLV92_21610, partial [Pirellulaceae bacterium]|nr:hypothetical protein [Pirellulaceae bacterium]